MSLTKTEKERIMRGHESTITRIYTTTNANGETVRRAHIRCANEECGWEENGISETDYREVEMANEHHLDHVLILDS